MTRAPLTLTMGHANRIHDLLTDLVPDLGPARPHNPLGVVTGSVEPIRVPINEVLDAGAYSTVTSAVYAVTDDNGIVRYVGSIHHSSPALRKRLVEHFAFRDRAVTRAWTQVGLVRLPDKLPHTTVLLCEGWVGRGLDPLDNDRLRSPVGRGPLAHEPPDSEERFGCSVTGRTSLPFPFVGFPTHRAAVHCYLASRRHQLRPLLVTAAPFR